MSTERQLGMGVGPIPRSAIKDYCEEYDIVGDEFDLFYRMIRAMDGHYLQQANSSSKPDKGTAAPVDDVEGVKGVIERIRERAATANKRQRKGKQQTH